MGNSGDRNSVGDYVTLVRGTTYKGTLVGQPGPALLGLGSIEPGGGFRIGNYRTYGGDCPTELMLYPGDIYASLKGATKDGKMIGSVARVPESVPSGRLTQDTVKLAFKDPNPQDASYLHWILRTPQYREYCAGHAMGSAVVALSRRDFLSYPVPPPTADRRAAAALLDAIEDRIEQNRRMNETLEAMARALFKSWFVDFDPVRAKADGRDPFYSPELWSLFPNAFGPNDKPAGWTRGTLIDLCELKRGYDLPSSERMPGPYPIVSSSGISGSHSAAMAEAPGVVTGRYGTIGDVYFINEPYWPLNTALYVRDFKGNSPRFVYYELLQVEFLQYSDKGAVPGINRNHLHQAPIVIPSHSVQQAFEKVLTPVWTKQEANKAESATLTALRDTLLPKLISGELRVKAAEKIVEAVA